MAEKPRDYEAELLAIMNALGESAAEASDTDILAEAREAGQDPGATAARVRGILSHAVKDYEQRYLRKAQRDYDERVQAFRAHRHSLPKTPEKRRALFDVVMKRRPELGEALVTAQNRDFK